jgi:repressor LexA
MSQLSPKQLEVLTFIHRFMETRGLPPTRGEIAEGLGLKNRQGIDQHLRALEMKGAIELLPGISRGIRIRDEGPIPFDTHRMTHTAAPRSFLPLFGRVAAGSPMLATENIEEHVQIDPAMFKPHANFLLRVRGDSMKEANILDRDLLAVHQTTQVRNGQIVVARIDDEATVKYYRRRGDLVRLEPANSDYAPIEIDLHAHELTIEGLAVGVIRNELGIR